MEKEQPKRRGRPSKSEKPAGSERPIQEVSEHGNSDGQVDKGNPDENGASPVGNWDSLIRFAEYLHKSIMVTQIRCPNPQTELVKFGDVGIPVFVDNEYVVITTDGEKHSAD
jgi:hypothetical protein